MLNAQFRDTIGHTFIHRGKVLQPTHRLLDGGNLSVKDMHAFYESYTRAVLRGENVYVVELKTEPVFKMFFDADIHSTEVLDNEWCERFAKYVMGAVSELFSESMDLKQMTMIICKAEPVHQEEFCAVYEVRAACCVDESPCQPRNGSANSQCSSTEIEQ